jgi:hypothetical protein
MEQKTSTATIEELFGMSADELRLAFREAFARRRRSINGYEIVGILTWLSKGFIGLDAWPEVPRGKIVCYWKAKDGSEGRWFDAWQDSFVALLRMSLMECATLPPKIAPVGTLFYGLTPKGQKFLSDCPERYRGAEQSTWPLEDQEFWTVIVEEIPNEPPAVYPYISGQEPDARLVLSHYDALPGGQVQLRVTGPHSIRWISRSAFAFDEYPALEGRVGPRIIRSWFDTVINAILERLKFEESLLERRDWTWRVPPCHLELLRPVREAPWQVNADNLEQFLSFYPNVEELIERHDRERSELEEACSALHNSLAMSRTFKGAYEKAKADDSPTNQGTTINDALLRGSDEQHLDLLAQYVVNTADELPGYYVYSPVWNKYSSSFLNALQDSAISSMRASAVEEGEKLLETVRDLITLLKETRARLSLWFDVPFVTAQPALDE